MTLIKSHMMKEAQVLCFAGLQNYKTNLLNSMKNDNQRFRNISGGFCGEWGGIHKSEKMTAFNNDLFLFIEQLLS